MFTLEGDCFALKTSTTLNWQHTSGSAKFTCSDSYPHRGMNLLALWLNESLGLFLSLFFSFLFFFSNSFQSAISPLGTGQLSTCQVMDLLTFNTVANHGLVFQKASDNYHRFVNKAANGFNVMSVNPMELCLLSNVGTCHLTIDKC